MSERLTRGLLRVEILLLAAIYLYFVIADHVPLIAWASLALIWVMRIATRKVRRTPFDLPIALLLALLPVGLAVSTNWSLSMPKVSGVILSVLFFYAVVYHVENLRATVFWLTAVFAAIALAGILGTDWAQNKIVSAPFVYERLPRVIQGIPRSIAGGFARNGVGGTLTLTIPFLFAMVIAKNNTEEHGHKEAEEPSPPLQRAHAPALVAIGTLLLSLFALALTQSRGGILGTALGLLAVAIWRERRCVWLVVAGLVGLGALFALGYGDTLITFVLRMDAGAGTLASRMEVWSRGVMMVQDFPYTGIGIGTYNDIAHALYPFFIAAPDEVVAHAHNNFLQVAVDLGIPGLIAYTALLTVFGVVAWRVYRAVPDMRALIAGAVAGIFAHQVFGLTDAFMLGTKPGLVLWIFCALVAVGDHRRRVSQA